MSDGNVESTYIRSKIGETSGTSEDADDGDASSQSNSADDVRSMSKEELVENYGSLVSSVAKDIWEKQSMSVPIEDVRAYGFEGLLEAQERYDPDENTSFSSYAYYRIQGAIYDGFRSEGWSMRDQSYEVQDYVTLNDHLSDHNRSRSHLPRSKTWQDSIRHIDQMVGDSVTILLMQHFDMEELKTTENTPEDDRLKNREVLLDLQEAINDLSENERKVIVRYHFQGDQMAEIADDLGYSKSWISRVNARAISSIREKLGGDE